MKYLLALTLLTNSATTSKVYVTEHGKKYHLYQNCMSLKSSHVITIDISKIGDRELCKICKHLHDKVK